MAERKRRPSSGKIKPGTPHPTKAHTVRGYDGRWVTRKHFNAVTKARQGAEKIKAEVQAKTKAAKTKGGSLVKRVTSAVTKSSKGDLLKIKKGDKGIVRAIKDTYKFGKDTRKSADAVYKAGKVTRKVHDQLVKGGKEFVKGTREAGKATRRAYERLKPGGKIVKTKGSKITKYTKPDSKIVRSPGGKVVKSPGGKVVKSPGGKMVKSPGGKLTTRAKVKAQNYKAPKVGKPLRAKTVAGRTAQRTAGQARKTARDTAKRARETKAVSNFNRAKLGKDSLKTRAGKTTKWLRGMKPKNLLGGIKQGVAYSAIGYAADQAVDRASHFLYNKVTGKKTKFKDHQSAMAALKDPKKPWFVKSKPKAKLTTTTTNKPKVTRNKRGRVVSKNTPLPGGKELSSSIRGKQKQIQPKAPEVKKEKPFENRISGGGQGNKQRKKQTTTQKQVPNKKKKQVSVGNMIGATIQKPKKKRMHAIEKRNREIHGDKAIDALKIKHKEWKKKRGRK